MELSFTTNTTLAHINTIACFQNTSDKRAINSTFYSLLFFPLLFFFFIFYFVRLLVWGGGVGAGRGVPGNGGSREPTDYEIQRRLRRRQGKNFR
jgi:hypothetical protein